MKIIDEKEFDEVTKQGVVLIDFFATWCGPCRMMADILEDVSKEIDERVQIYKVDVDQNENLARRFGIMSIPTLMVFKDGKDVEKHVGVWTFEDCKRKVEKYL